MLTFAFKSTQLESVDREMLLHWLAVQNDANAVNYRVVVHTDDRGTESRTLADARRAAVISELQAAGIQGAFNATLAAHDPTRRIVVVRHTAPAVVQRDPIAAPGVALAAPHPASAARLAAPSVAPPGTAVSREDSTTKEIHP